VDPGPAPELVTVPPGGRRAWVPLLELADEPLPLRRYLDEGTLYGRIDAAGAPEAGILVVDEAPGVAELRAVAVAESAQGRGIGTATVEAVLARLAARGVHTVRVGTASSGVRQLAFYQRCGFRLTRVEQDFFTEAAGYPPDLAEHGIPTRDMVWMERTLPRNGP
jgi:ribosomal protein S18 acetylase RimI-like enzyme